MEAMEKSPVEALEKDKDSSSSSGQSLVTFRQEQLEQLSIVQTQVSEPVFFQQFVYSVLKQERR